MNGRANRISQTNLLQSMHGFRIVSFGIQTSSLNIQLPCIFNIVFIISEIEQLLDCSKALCNMSNKILLSSLYVAWLQE